MEKLKVINAREPSNQENPSDIDGQPKQPTDIFERPAPWRSYRDNPKYPELVARLHILTVRTFSGTAKQADNHYKAVSEPFALVILQEDIEEVSEAAKPIRLAIEPPVGELIETVDALVTEDETTGAVQVLRPRRRGGGNRGLKARPQAHLLSVEAEATVSRLACTKPYRKPSKADDAQRRG